MGTLKIKNSALFSSLFLHSSVRGAAKKNGAIANIYKYIYIYQMNGYGWKQKGI
jgi:hypothetical protein